MIFMIFFWIIRAACGIEDLNKLQAKVTLALEKQIEKLLGSSRLRRDASSSSSAQAASEVGPDGKTKSTASAKSKTSNKDDKEKEPKENIPLVPLHNGHQPEPEGRLHDGSMTGPVDTVAPPHEGPLPGAPLDKPVHEEPKPDVSTDKPALDDHHEGPMPGAPVEEPIHHEPHFPVEATTLPPGVPAGAVPVPPLGSGGATVQKVKSSANMEKGTAVASAIAKRAAVLQNVDTAGNKAVSTAESHKGADTNVQTIGAAGNELGIATALVDDKNKTTKSGNPSLTVQKVAASGIKAVATAANKKEGGNAVQDAEAVGEEFAVANVSSGADEPIPVRAKRGVNPLCTDVKMNDDVRLLIRTTIENAFADIKKDMLS